MNRSLVLLLALFVAFAAIGCSKSEENAAGTGGPIKVDSKTVEGEGAGGAEKAQSGTQELQINPNGREVQAGSANK